MAESRLSPSLEGHYEGRIEKGTAPGALSWNPGGVNVEQTFPSPEEALGAKTHLQNMGDTSGTVASLSGDGLLWAVRAKQYVAF